MNQGLVWVDGQDGPEAYNMHMRATQSSESSGQGFYMIDIFHKALSKRKTSMNLYEH